MLFFDLKIRKLPKNKALIVYTEIIDLVSLRTAKTK